MSTRQLHSSLETQDDFEHWLFEMDDALERFHLSVPVEVRTRLDYSSASLDALEQWLLSQYSDHRTLLEPSEGAVLDGAARYVGETFRKTIGGKWQVRLEDPKYVHYRIPELTGFDEKPTPISPFTLTTACVDRRKGNYLRMILENMARRLGPRS